MQRLLEYTLFFITTVLFQITVFDNIAISNIALCTVYPIFILLLPLDLKPLFVVIISILLGITIDIACNTPAINTAATTLLGYLRSGLISLFIGKNENTKRGIPTSRIITPPKSIIYITSALLIHSFVVFYLESISLFNGIYFILRVVSTTILSSFMIFLCQIPLFNSNKQTII